MWPEIHDGCLAWCTNPTCPKLLLVYFGFDFANKSLAINKWKQSRKGHLIPCDTQSLDWLLTQCGIFAAWLPTLSRSDLSLPINAFGWRKLRCFAEPEWPRRKRTRGVLSRMGPHLLQKGNIHPAGRRRCLLLGCVKVSYKYRANAQEQ